MRHYTSGNNPALVGSAVYFYGFASAAPLPTYQWQLNGTNLPGATNANLVLTNLQTSQSGTYVLVASNVVGVGTSTAIPLSVIEPPLVYAYFSTGFSTV